MSRLGKYPIQIPEGVSVEVKNNLVKVTGPKGELQQKVDPRIKVKVSDGEIIVDRTSNNRINRSYHGLYRSLIGNMVTGVTQGFSKQLKIVGVGYRVESKGKALMLHLGFSHPIALMPPEGIEISIQDQNTLTVSGPDKELVGLVAAKIRSFRPPEPYKGKGIQYVGESIRRKAGKSAAG